MEKKSKKSILIGSIALLLITLTLLGLTYAYYRTRIIGNDKQSLSVTSELLELTYVDGSQILDADKSLYPGDVIERTFTVENTGDAKVEYGVYMEDVINEFVNKKDLQITLKCTSTSGTCNGIAASDNYVFPKTNTKMIENEIESGVTHTYELTLTYVNQDYDQAGDMEKILTGKIQIYAASDMLELIVDGTNLSDTDILQLNSSPKTAQKVDGKYTFVGVELGNHQLIAKDANGNELGKTNFEIVQGSAINVSNNKITVTEESLEIRLYMGQISNGNITFDKILQTTENVVETNGQKYPMENIVDAILASSESSPAKLTSDIILTKGLRFDTESTDMHLDLNGYTIMCGSDCSRAISLLGKNSKLTISNGNFKLEDEAVAVSVGQIITDSNNTVIFDPQNINLKVSEDVTINSDSEGLYVFGMNNQIDFYGTININGNGGTAFQTNGKSKGEIINIYPTASINVEGESTFGLYLSASTTVNIYGGTIKADTVIGIKAGTLNIEGGNLIATGENVTIGTGCLTISGGANTGDVVFAEVNDRYMKNIKINVAESATLSSANANKIRIHACNVSDPDDQSNTVVVTGKYTTPVIDSNNATITTYN